jgi:hypothetical protein
MDIQMETSSADFPAFCLQLLFMRNGWYRIPVQDIKIFNVYFAALTA